MASYCYRGAVMMKPEVERKNKDVLFEEGYPYKIPKVYLNGEGEVYSSQYAFNWDDDSVVLVREKRVLKYTQSHFVELLAENEKGEIVWVDGRNAPYDDCWEGQYLGQYRGADEYMVEEYDLESYQKKKYKVIFEEMKPMGTREFLDLSHFVDNDVLGNFFEIKDGVLKNYVGKDPNLVIPDSVTEIDWYAFAYVEGFEFESITIPKTVIEISPSISEFCKVKCLKIAEDNPKYYIKDGCLIDKETGTLVWAYAGSQIPDDGSVTKIGMNAFYNRTDLESIVIPNAVTEIDNVAFCGCSSLKKVMIPDSVIEIGARAFAQCDLLEETCLPVIMQGRNRETCSERFVKVDGSWTIEKSISGKNSPSSFRFFSF